jgi:hypothetical protein
MVILGAGFFWGGGLDGKGEGTDFAWISLHFELFQNQGKKKS